MQSKEFGKISVKIIWWELHFHVVEISFGLFLGAPNKYLLDQLEVESPYTGCLKKNATEIQQTVVHHKLN
jgi:hypothetical protein